MPQPRADGIKNNFRYFGIDFNTGLKRYTEKTEIMGPSIVKKSCFLLYKVQHKYKR